MEQTYYLALLINHYNKDIEFAKVFTSKQLAIQKLLDSLDSYLNKKSELIEDLRKHDFIIEDTDSHGFKYLKVDLNIINLCSEDDDDEKFYLELNEILTIVAQNLYPDSKEPDEIFNVEINEIQIEQENNKKMKK